MPSAQQRPPQGRVVKALLLALALLGLFAPPLPNPACLPAPYHCDPPPR
jgi:hypothetical protein